MVMVKHLSGANDSEEYREILVKSALEESMGKIQDCISKIERGRWRSAYDDLYYAVYHAAKAALFTRGKDPTSHAGTKLELANLAEESGFESGYIRFYGGRERLRNLSVYSYVGEVKALGEEEICRSLAEASLWLEKTVNLLVFPVIPSVGNFDAILEEHGMEREMFFRSPSPNDGI